MAQIVIFAPKGEDVSAGEQAIKDAGHDVEVVEATAENLLHLAIGMIGDKSSEEPETKKEPEEPEEIEDPLEEPEEAPSEESPEKLESLGIYAIDDESIQVRKGASTRLFVKELVHDDKTRFKINECAISIWENSHNFSLRKEGSSESVSIVAPVYKSKYGVTYLQVGPDIQKLLK